MKKSKTVCILLILALCMGAVPALAHADAVSVLPLASASAGAEETPSILLPVEKRYRYSMGSDDVEAFDYDTEGKLLHKHTNHRVEQDEYYLYYEDGTMKQKNYLREFSEYSDEWFQYNYETHFDKYGTQIEWYENYYTNEHHIAHVSGIPYKPDYTITREYYEDGQLKSFSAKGPAPLPHYSKDPDDFYFYDNVDIQATYQYDETGRILSYSIVRSPGDFSNECTFDYRSDGGYTQRIDVFASTGNLCAWSLLVYDSNRRLSHYEVHEPRYDANVNTDSPEKIEYTDYSYDEKGRETEVIWVYGGMQQGGERYEYEDTPGKTVMNYYSAWQSLDPPYQQVVIFYDDQGNEIEWTRYIEGEESLKCSIDITYKEFPVSRYDTVGS